MNGKDVNSVILVVYDKVLTGHAVAGEEALVFSYNLATPFGQWVLFLEFGLNIFSFFTVVRRLRYAFDNLERRVFIADVYFVK